MKFEMVQKRTYYSLTSYLYSLVRGTSTALQCSSIRFFFHTPHLKCSELKNRNVAVHVLSKEILTIEESAIYNAS